ncbi:organoarsenical effux MFS transporter ArsJ [Jannaschia sp. LMIT008]|uniref:organoarsenical effux MFS transporter ArsJ n=1 Tax=Jannaschia maritima TaxID=3032585 RepID=UPI00281164CB|nr:organoarsenical effux MFS transporter ArsJ [Jannaschia sp. LMIT008]
MTSSLRAYGAVTGAYWAFMLTDGALRMLVLLHFHRLGFTPLQLAWLFVLYEVAGIVTNLTAGWLAARFGLNATLKAGLALQVVALMALTALDPAWAVGVSVAYVMLVQGASGVAKDLSKTSAKSAVKLLAPRGGLFRWVAVLTGSKNAVKGLGFFLGAALLATVGFAASLWIMAAVLLAILVAVTAFLPGDLIARRKDAALRDVFSGDPRINRLSVARLFLFAARDVWFVVALPIWLADALAPRIGTADAFFVTGGFMALWIIGYGAVQAGAPRIARRADAGGGALWAVALGILTAMLTFAAASGAVLPVLMGLLVFGAVFAVNSSLHSFLILAYAGADRVTMDVGFYYMANAAGRLLGTVLSGLAYGAGGLALALVVAVGLALLSGAAMRTIPSGTARAS